jgi:hypothetical protein
MRCLVVWWRFEDRSGLFLVPVQLRTGHRRMHPKGRFYLINSIFPSTFVLDFELLSDKLEDTKMKTFSARYGEDLDETVQRLMKGQCTVA